MYELTGISLSPKTSLKRLHNTHTYGWFQIEQCSASMIRVQVPRRKYSTERRDRGGWGVATRKSAPSVTEHHDEKLQRSSSFLCGVVCTSFATDVPPNKTSYVIPVIGTHHDQEYSKQVQVHKQYTYSSIPYHTYQVQHSSRRGRLHTLVFSGSQPMQEQKHMHEHLGTRQTIQFLLCFSSIPNKKMGVPGVLVLYCF